ncbi:MAG TPA: hypothetical protein VFH03_00400, partial [Actinoplanes sp.]|nr:hypothetical protein [Actinoplanes sp.]
MTQVMASAWTPMSTDERTAFERDGFLVIRSVLNQEEVARARTAILRYRERAGVTGALHQLSAVTACPELAFLLDHPSAFRYIWSLLGWNIHVYHSHIDVHPQIREPQPQWWHWHQDGGRQNRELEPSGRSRVAAGRRTGDPRPRMSVTLAYWLSDVSE